MQWLVEYSPDLSKYGFRAWDDETYDFVMQVIRSVVPQGNILSQIEKQNNSLQKKVNEPKKEQSTKQTASKVKQTETTKKIVDELDDETSVEFNEDLYSDL